MSNLVEVLVPDIGNFDSVDVIEVLVKAGDKIAKEDSLITVESDKASMDIPAPQAGTVKEVKVKVGDKIAKDSLILLLDAEASASAPKATEKVEAKTPATEPAPILAPKPMTATGNNDITTQLVVLGSGPGGYTAAFRAADLGLKVVLIERYTTLGGVCLNVGCIPSKALLHTAKVITEAEETAAHGVSFGAPKIDLEALKNWKANDVVGKLTGGLAQMAKQREVTVVQGVGKFTSPNQVAVTGSDGKVTTIGFEQCDYRSRLASDQIPRCARR